MTGTDSIYGAILGDITGSPFEFDRGGKTRAFPLFFAASHFTDDMVMTAAVARDFADALESGDTSDLIFCATHRK